MTYKGWYAIKPNQPTPYKQAPDNEEELPLKLRLRGATPLE